MDGGTSILLLNYPHDCCRNWCSWNTFSFEDSGYHQCLAVHRERGVSSGASPCSTLFSAPSRWQRRCLPRCPTCQRISPVASVRSSFCSCRLSLAFPCCPSPLLWHCNPGRSQAIWCACSGPGAGCWRATRLCFGTNWCGCPVDPNCM